MSDLHDTHRRYTDREVALVLRRAAAIDERRSTDTAPARGLTLRELHEIAREVGLSPAAIDQAIGGLRSGAHTGGVPLMGAPVSHKTVRAVSSRLPDEALQGLIRVIEEQVDATGTVTEALGTVRWTSVARGHRFSPTMQVSLTPADGETQVQVVQRYPAQLRAILQFLPASWGLMIGGVVAASTGVGVASGVGLAAGTAILGLGIGRTVWRAISRRNERDVQRTMQVVVAAANDRDTTS
jgi:hypothetical protein